MKDLPNVPTWRISSLINFNFVNPMRSCHLVLMNKRKCDDDDNDDDDDVDDDDDDDDHDDDDDRAGVEPMTLRTKGVDSTTTHN